MDNDNESAAKLAAIKLAVDELGRLALDIEHKAAVASYEVEKLIKAAAAAAAKEGGDEAR